MAVLGGLFSPAKKLEGLVRNGEAALQKRDFAAATTLFEQAKELLEKNRGNKETDAFGVKVNLGLARALHGQGRTEEVFQYVDRGLEFEGDKAQLLEFLGTTLPTPLKDPISPGAYRTYKKGYALAPGNEKILLGYAAGAYAAGDFNTETHKVFERAYRAHRDFMPAIHGLGQTLAAAKQYDQTALEIYRQLLKLEPQNEIHKLNLARAYALMEKTPADAFGVIQWARKLQPEDPVFFEGLTKIYLQSDEMLESIYEHLLEAYHRTPSTAIARRLLPYLLRAKDTSDFAVEIYEQFWRDHERRDQILYLLSEHYQKAKRIDQPAVEVYEALFEVNPGAVGNTQLLASLYAHANRHDARALGVYELALADTDPSTMPEVVKAAAKGYAAQGRKDARARELYFTHLENMPQDTEILLLLGDIALQKKVLDERDLIVLEKLFKLPPIPKDYKLRVAKILAEHYTPRQRADETAINIYRFLWQFEPESLSPLGVQLLAHEMARQGEASKYAPLLKKALDSRYDAAIASGLAQAYLKEGRLDQEAIAHYLRVLREDPTNEAILSFVTPKILEGAEPSPEYYPIILGALERNPKPVLQRLAGEKGRGILLKMSRFLVEQRQYREAQVALEAAKQNFPADSEIDYRLAVVLAAQGNAPAALGILQHLAKTNPEPLIQYRLGQVALMGGKAQEAGRVFEELGRQFPNHPLLTARRGQLAELTGQPDQARQHYQALAQSKTPYAPFGALKLVMLNGVASTNGDEASIQSLTKDPIFGPQAQALLALRYFKLGKAEYDRTDYRGAARAWEQALELSGPGSYPLLRAALAEVLFRLGVEAFTKEQFTQAEAHFKRAGDVNEGHGAAALFEGVACHASGKLIKAKTCYERVMDRFPGLREEVGILYGKLELHKKHYDLANDLFEADVTGRFRPQAILGRAISFYLNSEEEKLPQALKGNALLEAYEAGLLEPAFLGVLFFTSGQAKEGAAILEKVVQKDTAEKRFPMEALFVLGLLYMSSDQRKLAFHHWQRLLDLSAADIKRLGDERGIPKEKLVELYYGLLYRYLQDSQVEEATAVLQKLEGLDPQGADLSTAKSYLFLQKGYLAAKEGAYVQAVNHWKECLKHAPNLAAYQNLGLVEMIKAHPDAALRYWKTYYDILERKVKTAPDENEVIQLNEARRIVNLLNTFQEEEEFKAAVKKEILIDDIEQVNQHYWTLGLVKGATEKEAEKSYFRLIRTYNPERYPKEFMQIEAAYGFFHDAARLRKAEILVFNGFNLHRALRNSRLPFKWGIPELPSIHRQIEGFTAPGQAGKIIRPQNYVTKPDMEEVARSLQVGDIQLVDYLAEW